MKKLLLALLMGGLIAGSAFAALNTTVEDAVTNPRALKTSNIPTTVNSTAIESILLDNAPTSVASGFIYVLDYRAVGFYLTYDETETGGGVEIVTTVQYSYDGTASLAGSFYDVAGGTTLQTTDTITADANYLFWLPIEELGWNVPYVQVTLTGGSVDIDDTALVSLTMFGVK